MRIGGKDAKRAFTRWEVLGRSGGVSLVEFTIETGRTHQIRVHSAHLGFPIVGDKLYGNLLKDKKMRKLVTRQLLHAVSLTICHPRTSKIMEFLAPPPHDIIFV
jgi:23S rRNA-/tRNA-specific pseudouridylate synthase